MKKTFLFIFSIYLSIIALNAQNYQILENGFDRVTLEFAPGQITSTDVNTMNGSYSRVTMEDYHLSKEVGKPQVPVMVKLLEIPLCDGVSYNIVSARYNDYSAAELGINNPLFPAQRPYTKSYAGPLYFDKDAETYQTDALYGRDLIAIEKSGIARNINIATVYFSPVQYNPVTEMYRIYESVRVEFTFENADIPATYEMKTLHGNAVFNGLQAQVINPINAPTREESFSRPIKYLIVSHSQFRGQFDEFVSWKKRQGLDVEVAYTDEAEVGTTTTSISNFIKSKYTNATPENPAPTYVLLIGDIQQIPVFNGQSDSHKTDLYYFTWTSGDHFPDCYYGRFSVQNATQLATMLEKTLQYEQYTMPDPTYLDKAILVAGTDSYWSATHANGQMKYLANNYINNAYGYSNVYLHLYQNNQATTSVITSEISSGVGYANYTAHCSEDGWADPSFETNNIPSLNNADKYCFMIGNCCLSNKFDENECFGEAITRTAQKGAVSYIGGTNSTIWDEDFYWSVGVRNTVNANVTYDAAHLGAYDRLFHTHNESFADWYITGGSIVQSGNLAVESATSSDYKLYYWEIYHILGDPSILPWLSQADVMTVSVDEALVSGATTLQVSAVPHAYVAITKNGEVIAAQTADANGVANLAFAPVTPDNTYELAVTAQNYQPFFKTITVIIPEGPYVVAANPRITNDEPANYGANLDLDVTLRNLGVENASNITAELSTTSPHITVNTNSISLAALDHDADQTFSAAYSISIAQDIADNTVAPMTITVNFDGQTTTTNFTLSLKAPRLNNTVVATAELEGNGNGTVNPGETCTLRITTHNSGHANAVGTYSHLSCHTNLATIVEDNLSLGEIPAQGDAVSEYTIQLDADVPETFIIPMLHDIYAGAYSFTDTVYLFVGEKVEDFETGDFSQYPWNATGTKAWTITTTNPYEGTYCATNKSGISQGQKSTLTISITASTNDSISYYRKVKPSNGWFGEDAFNFYIDNALQESITSANTWTRAAFPITAGTHTLKFEFDHETYGGSAGTAYIDYVRLPMSGEMATIDIEEFAENALAVYPNPATNVVNINVPSGLKHATLVVFDLNGNKVLSREVSAGEGTVTLNTGKLASGLYLISLFDKEQTFTSKFVKE